MELKRSQQSFSSSAHSSFPKYRWDFWYNMLEQYNQNDFSVKF